MKRILLFAFMSCLFLYATIAAAQEHLKNIRNKTPGQISNAPHGTFMDSTFFKSRIGVNVRDLGAAIEARGLTPYDLSSFNAALDTARVRKRLFIIPGHYNANTAIGTLTDSSQVWDFRNNRWDGYGVRTWGHRGIIESDTVQSLKTLYRNVLNFGGKIQLGSGTYTLDSLHLDKPVRLVGGSAKRPEDGSGVAYGSILQSTDTTGRKHLLTVTTGGVDLDNVVLYGNNRKNACGFYGHHKEFNSPPTTRGDYNIYGSSSLYHGGDGIRVVGGDAVSIFDTDCFYNGGYGIKITGPFGNYLDGGYENYPTGENGGINVKVWGGRARRNSFGGINIFQSQFTGLFGTESIQDTSVNLYIRGYGAGSVGNRMAENGSYSIGGDYEFAIPSLRNSQNPVANIKLRNTRQNTFINNYWGSVYYEKKSGTANAGTDSTSIVDSTLVANVDDYYAGWFVKNVTRNSAEVRITGYDASQYKLELQSSISGQSPGDVYKIGKRANRGVWADSVYSATFLNNAMASNADTAFVVHNFGNFLFLGGNQNFDPYTDIVGIGNADVNWGSISIDKLSTNGVMRYDHNTKTMFKTAGSNTDSTLIRNSNSGIEINSRLGMKLKTLDNTSGSIIIDPAGPSFQLCPSADANVYFFNNADSGQNRYINISGDNEGTQKTASLMVASDGMFSIGGSVNAIRVVKRLAFNPQSDSVAVSNSSYPLILTSIAKLVNPVYPFTATGNLVLSPRTSSPRDIVFMTGSQNPSTRVVISSNGNVGINTASPSGILHVNADNSSPYDSSVVVHSNGGMVVGNPAGGNKGPGSINATSIYMNGTLVEAGGEANTLGNMPGAGIGLAGTKSGTTLRVKRLKSGTGISVLDHVDSVSVNMTNLYIESLAATWAVTPVNGAKDTTVYYIPMKSFSLNDTASANFFFPKYASAIDSVILLGGTISNYGDSAAFNIRIKSISVGSNYNAAFNAGKKDTTDLGAANTVVKWKYFGSALGSVTPNTTIVMKIWRVDCLNNTGSDVYLEKAIIYYR